MDGGQDSRDTRYQQAVAQFGPALERLARAYERDPDLARDLLQDIHLALWRSLDSFDGRAALRTWVFRLAHNTGATHTLRQRRSRPGKPVSLEELDGLAAPDNPEQMADRQQTLNRLYDLIRRLKAPDQQVMLLYLEGEDGAAIGEVTGLSPGAVTTKIHRAKAVLARHFQPAPTQKGGPK
ncbi:RNA polymerase sigma factor [Nitrospirillum amazonense]|uniref:RNA polymerase sigma-70 factor (ECF subfamily) n=1 Tax=Nitrospirillum amazonense TaxID=28077 RepID=A0A560JB06_9PROT|nr:sigma-70 family RNA polymerase sigma factor [Nitrospirillum amazonense]MDG3442543.1 sigma-70 family RNA polymerase sigma factor [Nitrospirillum amazonense]TWB68383.1 RNA polymerase sigma-70 factor (ECF subfamily) [Nitrospirillum amazonense]